MNGRWMLLAMWVAAPAFGYSARLLEGEPTAPAVEATQARPSLWVQAGAGVGAAVVVVPASLYFAQWLGSLSNSLIWGVLPAVLVMALLPALAVSLAVTLAGNWSRPGLHRFWPTFAATTLINIGALVVAGFLGMSVGSLSQVLVFALVEAILLPATATATSRFFARDPASLAQAWRSNDPRAPLTWVVPTGTVSF